MLDQVFSPELVVADTMNFWIEREPKILADVLKRVDLLVINDEEARQLSGIHNLVKAAADIRRRGPKALVIKRGEFGALLFDEAGAFFVPAFPLEEAVDQREPATPLQEDFWVTCRRGPMPQRGACARPCSCGSASEASASKAWGRRVCSAIGRRELAARIDAFAKLVDHGELALPIVGSNAGS